MAGGRLWGALFFLFMSFAALSTVIAVFENILSFAMDLWGWKRNKAVVFNIVLIIILSMPAILGFGPWSGIQILGEGTGGESLQHAAQNGGGRSLQAEYARRTQRRAPEGEQYPLKDR